MRLFLFNPKTGYSTETIIERAQSRPGPTKRELRTLEQMGLIKRRTVKKQKKDGGRGGRQTVWMMNEQFPYVRQLEGLLTNTTELLHGDLVKKLARVGRLKLVIVAGVFTQNPESRVDLLIVGDNLKKRAIQTVLSDIESEIGKELRYTMFDSADFNYRLSVYDKLVRDILDYPHERLLDKMGVK